jgi:D-glycero-beta-D-manno-heptose 1-phosphate adenylyltransferase
MLDFQDWNKAKATVELWKSKGEKVVFTNGCFDILHLGHVTYLEAAAKLGDRLVVAVNDDASVRSLEKGNERPINPEYARAALISSLRCVDLAVIFTQATPLELIETLHPDILVKGGDYDPEETELKSSKYIVGSAETKKRGGLVLTIPLVAGFSTTNIVNRLKS